MNTSDIFVSNRIEALDRAVRVALSQGDNTDSEIIARAQAFAEFLAGKPA